MVVYCDTATVVHFEDDKSVGNKVFRWHRAFAQQPHTFVTTCTVENVKLLCPLIIRFIHSTSARH
jgi:hypothetical protein